MRYFAQFLLVLLVSFSFSCSGDDDEDVITKEGPFKISELAGTWEATQAYFGGESMTVDVIDEGGTATLNVQSSGRFTLNIDPVDRAAYTVSGEMFWEEWEGRFYFAIEWSDSQGDWDTYGHTKTATTFTLNGGFDSGEYDFDNDGDMEPCSISFAFVKA